MITLQLICYVVGNMFSVRIQAELEIGLKNYIFGGLLRKKYEEVTSYHSGELLTRLTGDISIVCSGMVNIFPNVLYLGLRFVGAFAVLAYFDLMFSLVFIAIGAILLVIATYLKKRMKALHHEVQQTEGKVRSFQQEMLENLLAVKTYGMEEQLTHMSGDLQQVNYRAKIKRRNVSIIANCGFTMIFQIGFICALIWSSYRLYLGVISVGTLTAVLQLVTQMQSPVSGLAGILPQYYSMLASAERLMEVEALEAEEQLRRPAAEITQYYETFEAIVFDDVSFSYGEKEVLSHYNLRLNKGDFFVLYGDSGIGKSTLMKLLLGVYKVMSGEITLILRDGTKMPLDETFRGMFAYVPQGNFLLSGTLRENLQLVAPQASEEQIAEALQISCCYEFVAQLPNGIDTQVGEKGHGLSEGQIQRVAVARAILSEAPILLLDEATSALDAQTEERMLANLKAMQGKTCLMISHKEAAFGVSNRSLKMEK